MSAFSGPERSFEVKPKVGTVVGVAAERQKRGQEDIVH